jgi:prophage antirepressor-like protein
MKETKFRKNGKMTAGQERQTHKKAEIKSFHERKNNRKQKKTKENKRKQKKIKGGIYDV